MLAPRKNPTIVGAFATVQPPESIDSSLEGLAGRSQSREHQAGRRDLAGLVGRLPSELNHPPDGVCCDDSTSEDGHPHEVRVDVTASGIGDNSDVDHEIKHCDSAMLGKWRPGHRKSARPTPWRSSRRRRPMCGSPSPPRRRVACIWFPVTHTWIGSRHGLTTEPGSRTVANVTANPRVRLALGETRDVVMVDAILVEAVPAAEGSGDGG